MESIDIMRTALVSEVIPKGMRDGVHRVYLPRDLTEDRVVPEGECLPPYNPRTHHAAPELDFFLSGCSPLWVSGRTFRLQPGDVVLLPPKTNHSPAIRARYLTNAPIISKGPTALRIVVFPFGVMADFFQTLGELGYYTHQVVLADRRICEATELLLEELTSRAKGYETVAQALLLEIVARASRAPAVQMPTDATVNYLPKPQKRKGEPQLVAAAKDYLSRRYDQHLSIPSICRHLNVSPSLLSREFKRTTGVTIVAYRNELRVAAAKHLLETPLPIAAIAELVGFDDPYYFSRVFRRTVGKSASRVRAEIARQDAK